MDPLLDATARVPGGQKTRHRCLDWLDEQPPASVLYVSFGTTSSLAAEQVVELAAALRDSKRRFLWALRDADRGVVREEAVESRHARFLSEFTEQIRGTGLVVATWAPQLEILAHGATAAFMSHCGWNSAMESLSTWQADARLAHALRPAASGGARVQTPQGRGHGEAVGAAQRGTPAGAVCEVISKMMTCDEGLAVREKASALGESIRASVAEGGSSRKDLDNFITYVTR
ncbi:uncharacterized protein C2845_PM15G17290 [Panicum miliaceum]|uniref:Uncharacterized protein n=1 Tax=Panicum miliaceum TaxID=4540 RepID=A0A3L6Q757_PANMI|nr:uncharacterized protein C2845_PM15G17290 [Panicum miliaceum]